MDERDINDKIKELHEKWKNADGPSITFNKTEEQKKQYSDKSQGPFKKLKMVWKAKWSRESSIAGFQFHAIQNRSK